MKGKQVLKVEMFGKTLIVQRITEDQFRVYEIIGIRNPYHLGTFGSFQEAWTAVEIGLWN